MRHGNKLNHLSRKSAHRKAMLSNMACSLIEHKRISTTIAKAKALRVYVEPLLTKSKTDTTHSRRIVFSYLQDKYAITELFGGVAEKIANRPGGYTRIIKLGARVGDNAEIAMIELVDFNEIYGKGISLATAESAKKTRRSGSKAKASATTDEVVTAEAVEVEAAPKAKVSKAPKADKTGDDLV